MKQHFNKITLALTLSMLLIFCNLHSFSQTTDDPGTKAKLIDNDIVTYSKYDGETLIETVNFRGHVMTLEKNLTLDLGHSVKIYEISKPFTVESKNAVPKVLHAILKTENGEYCDSYLYIDKSGNRSMEFKFADKSRLKFALLKSE